MGLGLGLFYYLSDKVEDANVIFFDRDVLEAVALTVTERIIQGYSEKLNNNVGSCDCPTQVSMSLSVILSL